VDAERPAPRTTRRDRDSTWPERPDWWPDPPDARELEEDAAAREAEAAAADVEGRLRPDRAEELTDRDRASRPGPADERPRHDPPTLPDLPNQWAELPPTVPQVPEPPHGIRRSTILLILLWLAVLAFYLWVRPVG
jgi:hypothetical protein